MATPSSETQIVEGVVEQANDTGVLVGGVWLNRSKFKPVVLPARGERVRLEVKAGFIRAVLSADGSPRAPGMVAHPAGDLAESAARGVAQQGQIERDQQIRRLALVKAAAGYLAARPEAKAADVVRVAAAWEQWVVAERGAERGGEMAPPPARAVSALPASVPPRPGDDLTYQSPATAESLLDAIDDRTTEGAPVECRQCGAPLPDLLRAGGVEVCYACASAGGPVPLDPRELPF
jgi:hypothetical protein